MSMIDRFEEYGPRISLIHDASRHTYRDLKERIDYYLSLFSEKSVDGRVVAIVSDYSFEAIAVFFALAELRCILVPITSTLPEDVSKKIAESEAEVVVNFHPSLKILDRRVIGRSNELISRLKASQNSGLILFSSGSTGKSKAMIHNLDDLIEAAGNDRPKKLTVLLFLMFDHIGGLNTMIRMLTVGATIAVPTNREVDHVARVMEQERVNILPTSPTFLNLMLIANVHERYNLKYLRMITYGTEPMPTQLLERLRRAFPRARLIQTFGTSETGITQTVSESSDTTFMRIEDPNVEYKIVKGELWLKSKTQVLGYLNAAGDCFTDDGWFMTGDLVEEAEDGSIKIIGRNKEVINMGGQKVLPQEVEAVLNTIPEIRESEVYGFSNVITGQVVMADIVVEQEIGLSELKKVIRVYCKDHLENFKIPVKVKIVAELNYSDRFKRKRRTI